MLARLKGPALPRVLAYENFSEVDFIKVANVA